MNHKPTSLSICALALVISASYFETAHAASSRADAFARDYARNASRQGHVVRRGLFGGLLGAAATGGAAAGVAVGTGVGVLSGDRKRQRQAEKSTGQRTAIAWRAAFAKNTVNNRGPPSPRNDRSSG
jgi:hypothetical protein